MRIEGNGETFLEIAILTAVRVKNASEIIKGKNKNKKNPKRPQKIKIHQNPKKTQTHSHLGIFKYRC